MIHLFCALKCEAKPLLDHYRLNHHAPADVFPVYVNQQQNISLTITGIGKQSAAAAVIYTWMLLEAQASDAWLNVGMAGHGNMNTGNIALANHIIDADSQQGWYPQILFDTDLPRSKLLSLSTPCTDYRDCLYDMEAAGFYASVTRIATSELCHCLKIISDNPDNPAKILPEKAVHELIQKNLDAIIQTITQLQSLSDELASIHAPLQYYEQFQNRWHFTQYEKNRLRQLLQRWQALFAERDPLSPELNTLKNSSEVLAQLEHTLDTTPVRLD